MQLLFSIWKRGYHYIQKGVFLAFKWCVQTCFKEDLYPGPSLQKGSFFISDGTLTLVFTGSYRPLPPVNSLISHWDPHHVYLHPLIRPLPFDHTFCHPSLKMRSWLHNSGRLTALHILILCFSCKTRLFADNSIFFIQQLFKKLLYG